MTNLSRSLIKLCIAAAFCAACTAAPAGALREPSPSDLPGLAANVAEGGLTEEQQNEANRREDRSDFDQRDVVSESAIGDGEKRWMMNPDANGTPNFWIDLDRDQTPDTQVFVLPDAMYYDRNANGSPDTLLD